MSIQRVKAGAGVALEKGLGAEGRKNAHNRPWHCGKYPLCCRSNAESYPHPVSVPLQTAFMGRGTLFCAPLPFKLKNAGKES